jgi:hypothetical protein
MRERGAHEDVASTACPSADRSGHVIARWLGGGNAARTDHELCPELPVILRFDFVMDCPPRRGVRAQGAEDSLPLLIRITRRGSLGRHATLDDGGTVRILTEAVPCDRTAILRRRDHASHERCAKSKQDEAVSHHAGPLGVVCDAPSPLTEACVAPLKWNLRETRGRHGRIWMLLSHHIARAVRPLREIMRTASHNNWRNIRL